MGIIIKNGVNYSSEGLITSSQVDSGEHPIVALSQSEYEALTTANKRDIKKIYLVKNTGNGQRKLILNSSEASLLTYPSSWSDREKIVFNDNNDRKAGEIGWSQGSAGQVYVGSVAYNTGRTDDTTEASLRACLPKGDAVPYVSSNCHWGNSFRPAIHDTYSLGNANYQWKHLYISGNITQVNVGGKGNMVDYVIEQGTKSGNLQYRNHNETTFSNKATTFYYRIWASGKKELWGNQSFTTPLNVACVLPTGVSSAETYEGNMTVRFRYPSDFFTATTSVQLTIDSINKSGSNAKEGGYLYNWGESQWSNVNSAEYAIRRQGSSSLTPTFILGIYAYGY